MQAVLFEAAAQLRPVGGSLTPEAIHVMVASDLLPAFLPAAAPNKTAGEH